MINIQHLPPKLIKNLLAFLGILAILLWGQVSFAATFELLNPSGKSISLRLALTEDQKTKGLSGLKPDAFSEQEGMLFVNKGSRELRFWMPDTYFNLDIIFLNTDLKIVGIEKNVTHHPGFKEPPMIYRTKTYWGQFVLETKAGVEFSKNLKVGDQLKWKSTTSLSEIILKTHP